MEIEDIVKSGNVDEFYMLIDSIDNPNKVNHIYETVLNCDNSELLANLGSLFEFGLGKIPQDYTKAVALYTKASDLGNPDTQFNLANLYYEGTGVEQNYLKAAELFMKSAAQGNIDAQVNLGSIYELGLGVEQDYEKAAELYELAVEQGDSYAKFNLANLYYDGLGVEEDIDRAIELYTEAAEDGDEDAKEMLEKIKKEEDNDNNSNLE